MIVLKTVDLDTDTEKFLNARGCELRDGHLKIPFPCPHLENNLCKIYDKRPRLCRIQSCESNKHPFNKTFDQRK